MVHGINSIDGTFAPQHIMSCTKGGLNLGCQGGFQGAVVN